jgi:4'-phosphopantetheinyl transferase
MRVAETALSSEWLTPPNHLLLRKNEVHVWRASLHFGPADVESFKQTLSPDEISKADRFYFKEDRRHFIAARGLLRTILGRYLKIDPRRLRFCYSLYGKPALLGESGKVYSFNLSHSYGLLLVAITRGREIGIDVECIRAESAGQEIAERFFAPNEVAKLFSLPKDQKDEAFFRCWTRKEAYVKAKGDGLTIPLDQFEVSLSPGEPAELLHIASSGESRDWFLEELYPGPGYMAALAVRERGLQLQCWQWIREKVMSFTDTEQLSSKLFRA